MAKKKKPEKDEQRPEAGAEGLRAILEGAQGVDFEDGLPENLPPYESLPEIDRELAVKKCNDWGNGQRLVARFGNNLIFVDKAGWYGWTGRQWSLDDGPPMSVIFCQKTADAIMGEALAVMAAGPKDNEAPKKFLQRIKAFYRFAFDSGNNNRLTAMARQAAPHLRKKAEDLDTHHYLLNLQNGTLNLKAQYNGEESFDGIVLEEHKPEHLITKIFRASYDPSADAPTFRKFIAEVMPDQEIRLFLQRFFGYCLTGETSEQVIVMFWGGGSNGKSTLMDLISWIMGDYALVTPFASLLHDDRRRGSEASPDLARLPGARLVSAAEPDTGARFSESILKQLTGGENMTVRHLRQDFFEFKPQFKLCLSFNNKPQIRGQDEGIWRRILLVPFTQRFVEARQLASQPGALPKIKDIDKKLRAETSGILNWMLDGYRMWAEKGLDIPDKVRAATAEYRHELNPVFLFMEAWCDRKPNGTVQASRLYDAYVLWCKDNAFDPMTQNIFGRLITAMQVERYTYQVVYYRGIELNTTAENRILEEENKRQRRREGTDT